MASPRCRAADLFLSLLAQVLLQLPTFRHNIIHTPKPQAADMRTYCRPGVEQDALKYAALAILLAVRVFSLLSRSAFAPTTPYLTLGPNSSRQAVRWLGVSSQAFTFLLTFAIYFHLHLPWDRLRVCVCGPVMHTNAEIKSVCHMCAWPRRNLCLSVRRMRPDPS